jgi:hypothetical protein
LIEHFTLLYFLLQVVVVASTLVVLFLPVLFCFVGLAYQGQDIVFRFIIEYSSFAYQGQDILLQFITE